MWAQSKLATSGIIATSGGSSFLSIVATRDELDNFTTCAGASHFKGKK
jgi:hypothetical protein